THTHKHLLCERIYPTDSFLPFCCGVTIRSLFHASTVHTLAPPVSPTLAPLTHTHTHTHTHILPRGFSPGPHCFCPLLHVLRAESGNDPIEGRHPCVLLSLSDNMETNLHLNTSRSDTL